MATVPERTESGPVRSGLSHEPLTLLDRARQDGVGMQGISSADQRALGEWAARVALGHERKDSAAGVDHGHEQ